MLPPARRTGDFIGLRSWFRRHAQLQRREGIDAIKKAHKEGGVTEDDLGTYEKEIQKLTDGFVKKIDDAFITKEAEILKV